MDIEKLKAAHEGLLNTLSPSKSAWIRWVVRNAKAHYETLKKEGK